jgi:hypothetical protein
MSKLGILYNYYTPSECLYLATYQAIAYLATPQLLTEGYIDPLFSKILCPAASMSYFA